MARFRVLAVIDGRFGDARGSIDAGQVMEGRAVGVPVFDSMESFEASLEETGGAGPECVVVGVAFPGGQLPAETRPEILGVLDRGLDVYCGLHQFLSDDPELSAKAAENGARLIDIRRPRPATELHFWEGDVHSVGAVRVAVLGTDCAVGKRTTASLLLGACREAGVATEMIYTGQTGWMLGLPWGFILDATPNDFVSGELERAITACDGQARPELILIEGQSALRNPSGPCGSELLLSADLHGVILQHAPGREFFHHQEALGNRIPAVEDEVDLIRRYGVETLGLALHGEGLSREALAGEAQRLQEGLGIPVVRPLEEGVNRLVPALREIVSSFGPPVR